MSGGYSNPSSGKYVGSNKSSKVELAVDIDQTTKNSKALRVLSGTVIKGDSGYGFWPPNSEAVFFKTVSAFKITEELSARVISSGVKAAFSEGLNVSGRIVVKVYFDESSDKWKADIELELFIGVKISFDGIEKRSTFFGEFDLDIGFTNSCIWPTVNLKHLGKHVGGYEDKDLTPDSAFADAGLKLNKKGGEEAGGPYPFVCTRVDDPTPHDPWTKSDFYNVLTHYHDNSKKSGGIWCLLGNTPPDEKQVGYSVNHNGYRGFSLFLGHRKFAGLKSDSEKKRAKANRILLHYFVRECGKALGLQAHEETAHGRYLSWTNSAWKYDGHASFYDDFNFTFNEEELLILRHSPGELFAAVAEQSVVAGIVADYSKKDIPDIAHKDGYGDATTSGRKITLDLKLKNEYSLDHLLSFEARIKNNGQLPVLVEEDLSIESGNLQVYLRKPGGQEKAIRPFIHPIYGGHSKQRVIYPPGGEEGSDRYSELVIVGEEAQAHVLDVAGKYEIRVVFKYWKYEVSSRTYAFDVTDGHYGTGYSKPQALSAATVQGYNKFPEANSSYEKMYSSPADGKETATVINVLKGKVYASSRQPSSYGENKLSLVSYKDNDRSYHLDKTGYLLKYYQKKGGREHNVEYSSLVLTRAKLLLAENKANEADQEFDQLKKHLKKKGVKSYTLKKLAKTYEQLKKPSIYEEKQKTGYLRGKIAKALKWGPDYKGIDAPDISGIGVEGAFGDFSSEHRQKASKILKLLLDKYDESQDLYSTISFASKLQKSREVNHHVIRWALQGLTVHSKDARKAGIRFPEPELLDVDASIPATTGLVRKGDPAEDWINYWRCDADLNYHHRHWHLVYRLLWIANDPEEIAKEKNLQNQGQLFAYMHEQMVARYNAERESWGLPTVTAWQYEDTPIPFNAGIQFDQSKEMSGFIPRPSVKWAQDTVTEFRMYEKRYHNAVNAGFVAPGVDMTADWAGHVIEPSSSIYTLQYDSIHNTGHMVFSALGETNEERKKGQMSYMGATETAVRDPVFFNWHKRIDNLWQANNERFITDLYGGPPITITPDDIVITPKSYPPEDFGQWSNGDWSIKGLSDVSTLHTTLGPPMKKFELDNKLNHESFYYHLRLKKNENVRGKEVNLTIRIFICPKKRQAERKRWIEMDKFVVKLDANTDHISFSRADIYSSVIKRQEGAVDPFERHFVKLHDGFCECGWPYTMLLPRGKSTGEEYVICVLATDNDKDRIGIQTKCGSMSYCGAKDVTYPDKKPMGYPFSTPIAYNGKKAAIPAVFDLISNAAYKTFKIENNVAEDIPIHADSIWSPYTQLHEDDGTDNIEPNSGITNFIPSQHVGSFRVVIRNSAITPKEPGKIFLRFHGRGRQQGHYTINKANIGRRDGNSLNITGETVPVTVNGKSRFDVPEIGIFSDPVDFHVDPAHGDYFVTFSVKSPGVILPAGGVKETSTFFAPSGLIADSKKNWSEFSDKVLRYPSIEVVSGVLAELD